MNENEIEAMIYYVDRIMEFLNENKSVWNDIRWRDKEGNGFDAVQGCFVEGLENFKDYLLSK